MKFLTILLTCFILTGTSFANNTETPPAPKAQSLFDLYWLSVELGPAWQSMNDVAIPSKTGTRFSISDLSQGPFFTYRIYAGMQMKEHHQVRLLFSPLAVTIKGKLKKDTSFQDDTFLAKEEVESLYQFNSYRLTYRYRFLPHGPWVFYLGFTGKIRDAEIALTQGKKKETRTNVGFVPLLHFTTHLYLPHGFNLNFDMDALAAPQGRAEDIALRLGYDYENWLTFRAGYRMVEGGSEGGGNVYTFAWLHYLTFGFTARY